ncbi:MAG: methyltransferase domain-containing protein [Methanothrix sp.]|jgi:ubiquinone/menaquinone biosynthesis C-methylase UbiE|nr:methyltransferase domain-containing protein [Methanothrix sp.]
MANSYVHGYHERESIRLQDQASTLEELLHGDTFFPAGSLILEAGCGVGAQTVPLAKRSPGARITAVDISEASAREARRKVDAEGLENVRILQGDIFNLPFRRGSFDHIFLCFVLEHLPKPIEALSSLKKFIKPGGSITAIEGDHGSAYFHPDSVHARRAIECQVQLQRKAWGNAMIGRELYPLLRAAGFSDVSVSPRMVYVDSSKPELVEGFTKKTFTAMIEGIGEAAVGSGMIERGDYEKGIRDLYRTAEVDGVFCYTFFKARGMKV